MIGVRLLPPPVCCLHQAINVVAKYIGGGWGVGAGGCVLVGWSDIKKGSHSNRDMVIMANSVHGWPPRPEWVGRSCIEAP